MNTSKRLSLGPSVFCCVRRRLLDPKNKPIPRPKKQQTIVKTDADEAEEAAAEKKKSKSEEEGEDGAAAKEADAPEWKGKQLRPTVCFILILCLLRHPAFSPSTLMLLHVRMGVFCCCGCPHSVPCVACVVSFPPAAIKQARRLLCSRVAQRPCGSRVCKTSRRQPAPRSFSARSTARKSNLVLGPDE